MVSPKEATSSLAVRVESLRSKEVGISNRRYKVSKLIAKRSIQSENS